MFRHSTRLVTLTVFALFLAVTGCSLFGSDDDDGNGGDSSFNVSVSGASDFSLSGEAFFFSADDPAEQERGFGIGMLDADPSHGDTSYVVLARESPERPGEDSYDIGSTSFSGDFPEGGAFYGIIFSKQHGVFLAESGGLTINSSGDNQLNGEFEFTGTSTRPPHEEFNVEGSFEAVPGSQDMFEEEETVSLEVKQKQLQVP
jgi:hypothetical protein